jgi:hypothetical protein
MLGNCPRIDRPVNASRLYPAIFGPLRFGRIDEDRTLCGRDDRVKTT